MYDKITSIVYSSYKFIQNYIQKNYSTDFLNIQVGPINISNKVSNEKKNILITY